MRREKHHGIDDNDDIDDVDDIVGAGPMRVSGDRPMAVVLGARVIEVVRSLAMEGIPVGLVTPTGDPARWSRCARNVMTWDWMMPAYRHDEALADRLVAFARQQAVPPVLMYCSDQSMVFVSQHRERLAEGFRFIVPKPELVAAMEDKAQFAALAAEHSLPVPPTVVLDRSLLEPPGELLGIGMPIIIKPTARDQTWVEAVGSSTKALRIESKEELLEFWPRLSGLSKPAVAQQSIPGPETAVVSYHVYVDDKGEVAGEFTGRKIRTIPAEYGHTSSLTITDDPEVARLGREVCRALDLRGVAKLDFKYAPDGRLHLFEINARLTLWAHPGARAGVNLPALVYADLVGTPRPQSCRVRTCLDWAHPKDALAARAHGISMREWLGWLSRPGTVKGVWRWNDPGPLLGMLAVRVKSKVSGSSAEVPD
jgi:predicted ATP-grasp superfamily ATP-dependent carboligase